MLRVPCPNCFRSLAVREESAGSEVRCICGHQFVASMPLSATSKSLEADAAARRQAAASDQSFWTRPLAPGPPATDAIATRGPITCPYCEFVAVDDANLLGQRVLCPKCNASFRAPDWRVKPRRIRVTRALLKYLVGFTLVIIAFQGFVRGEVDIFRFGMFAVGFGIIALTLWGTLKRLVSISSDRQSRSTSSGIRDEGSQLAN
jgi:hypothetical protein